MGPNNIQHDIFESCFSNFFELNESYDNFHWATLEQTVQTFFSFHNRMFLELVSGMEIDDSAKKLNFN